MTPAGCGVIHGHVGSAPACRCGCPAAVHEHCRDGSDCGRCGRVVCPRYRKPTWWRRWLP